LITSLFKKGLSENPEQRRGQAAQRFWRMVLGQWLCCTLTPVCFSLQVQAGAKKFQVLMMI
jgi:Na+/melibiose symporter-like transporter